MLDESSQTLLAKISSAAAELDDPEFIGAPPLALWIGEAVEALLPEELAIILEALPTSSRKRVFQALPSEQQKPVFLAMQEESRRALVKQIDVSELGPLLDEFDAEALLELAEELPERFIAEALERLDTVEKERFERASKYDVEKAGHWVNFDFAVVYSNLKVSSALRQLKRTDSRLPDRFYIQNKKGILVGELDLANAATAEPGSKVADLMQEVEDVVQAGDSIDDAADSVILSGRVALPVVEEDGRILGRLTLSTAYEHREELADKQFSAAGGLAEDEDLFAPVWRSSRNRAIWLGINLLTAFLASWCIGLFEATLQQVVTLAILMPVVASMGGISGSQTLTVIVRALALGKITDANRRGVLKKEFRVGVVNGLLWALIIGQCVYWWFGELLLGFTIAFAILVNIIIAVVAGVLIPAALDKLKLDPALSGSVVLTTVTDVVGFVVFLGVGAIILT